MRNKFANFIMSIITILIIAVMCLFGIIIWEEVQGINDTETQIADFETVITGAETSADTIDKDIKAPNIIGSTIEKLTGKSSSSEKIDYSQVKIDNYFFNQLEEDAKTIYRALEANKENMKTGTYQIELGDAFSNLLNTENGQDLLSRYYQSAIEAFTYDNPSVFYLSPNKMYLNVEKTTNIFGTKYNVFINKGNEQSYLMSEFSSKESVDSAVNGIEQVRDYLIANKVGDPFENIKNVHDFLVDNIEYDTSLSSPNIYDVYGALINRVCVCEGYARAFKYIMDEMGIPCILVIGEATNSQGQTENHAWNYVSLHGSWYAIDTTWDDPVVIGNGKLPPTSKYKYFLKGETTMNKDHTPNGQFTESGKVFEYPILSLRDY